jgi:hypothetical protein
MIKKHRNKKHLDSLILGAIENDRVDELAFYTKLLDNHNNQEFLTYALTRCKLESSKFLYGSGFTFRYGTNNALYILMDAPIHNLDNVYNLITNLSFSGELYKFGDYTSESVKKYCVKRLLDPYKVLDNPKRIDIAMDYIKKGFFTEQIFEEALTEISEKHKESRFKNVVNQYVREYKLNKIL